MTADEALEYADEQIAGATFYEGKRDIVVALALLASEVKRLRKFPKPKYMLSDLFGEMDTDEAIPGELNAWLKLEPIGREKGECAWCSSGCSISVSQSH